MMLSPMQLKVIVDISVIKDNRRKSYLIIILYGTETLRNKIPPKNRENCIIYLDLIKKGEQ